MMWSFFLNGIVGFFVLIAFLFAIPDISAVQSAVSGSPFLYVFQSASYWGSMPLIVLILLVMLTGSIDANASTSRQTFAFARDGGLPGSVILSNVSKVGRTAVPRNAIIFTCLVTCLLALINIGSSVAFNAIISLQLMALMATYTISIGCVLYQRTLGGGVQLPYARWSLGRFGAFVNSFAFIYSIQVLFWTGWPGQGSPLLTPQNMNWSSVMFVGVSVISLVYYFVPYFVHGCMEYRGPVVLVRPMGNPSVDASSN
jgi:choline transport protein